MLAPANKHATVCFGRQNVKGPDNESTTTFAVPFGRDTESLSQHKTAVIIKMTDCALSVMNWPTLHCHHADLLPVSSRWIPTAMGSDGESDLTVNQSGSRSRLLRCVYFPCGTDGCTWSSVELASLMPFASAPIDSVRPVDGKRWRIFEAEDGALSRGSVCRECFITQRHISGPTSHSAPVIQKSLPSNSVAPFDGNSIKSHCSTREIRFVSRKKRNNTGPRGVVHQATCEVLTVHKTSPAHSRVAFRLFIFTEKVKRPAEANRGKKTKHSIDPPKMK